MTIAIIREEKNPPDARVPLSPKQCSEIMQKLKVKVIVERSTTRCFLDNEYAAGIELIENAESADIFLGVKEVPIHKLLPEKTYLFFSHTIKKQPYNRNLLQEIVRKKIRLIDYELLTDEKGIRVIAFGRWAGIVGAHNGLWTWGKKKKVLPLKRVFEYKDFETLKSAYKNILVPPVKIIITGDGRVAGGALEVMDLLKIERLSPEEFLKTRSTDKAIYTQLSPNHIYTNKNGKVFELQHFFRHPHEYNCDFKKWYESADLMINAIFWDPRAPRYFTFEEMASADFKIEVIADISCDINGSVPATIRATTIADPVFGFDPIEEKETSPFQEHTIDIMAIDNLPNELPRDASENFGEILANVVLPELLKEKSEMIEKATIAANGDLTAPFEYLRDYVQGE